MSESIDLYGATSPNVVKVRILLEELNIKFNYIVIDVHNGQQYSEEFKKLNPNSKVPCLVDKTIPDKPLVVFESGNILLYLAEKYGKFIPKDTADRVEVLNFLFWQMASIGPNIGNFVHFTLFAKEKIDYPIQRFTNETSRLLHVLNSRLKDRKYVGGEYSIADIAIYPWIRDVPLRMVELANQVPNVVSYISRIREREAVKRFEEWETIHRKIVLTFTDEQREILFNRSK